MSNKGKKRSRVLRFPDRIEAAGSKLPSPLTIFFYPATAAVIISGISAALGWSAPLRLRTPTTLWLHSPAGTS